MATEHECEIFPLRPDDPTTVLGSTNMEVTVDGAVPSFAHAAAGGSANESHFWGTPIETKNPSGQPRLYAFVNRKVKYFEDGSWNTDTTFDDVVQGLAIIDTVVGGALTQRLIAGFGSSTTGSLAGGGHAWRNLGTDTAPWSYHVGATALQFWLAEPQGPDTFVVTGTVSQGRTQLYEHMIAKIAAGVYSGLATDAAAGEPVDRSDWPVIGIVGLQGSVVAGKGSGPYRRDNVDKIYKPLRKLSGKLPHGLNCKGMAPSENGVFIPSNDGRLFEYDGSSVHEVTPVKDASKPKDTQRGRIEFIADRGDVVAVGYAVAQEFIQGKRAADLGVRVFIRTGAAGGTWSELTSGVCDGSLVTPASANMGGWGGNATDRLLVISPFPLAAIIPRVTRNTASCTPNAAVNSFTNPQGSSAGAETAGSLSVDLGSVRDGTILGVAATSLAIIGMPPAAAEPILGWDSISSFADVGASSALTITGIAGSPFSGFYAYEWSPTNTTAMTATTTIDEIDFVPARPGLGLNDPSGPFIATKDFSSLEASGMLTDVYFGRRVGYGNYEWSNPYTLNTGGGILVAAWTTALTGATTNGGQALMLMGRFGQYLIAEGQTRDPRRTRYPKLCQYGTSTPGPKLSLNNIVFRESGGKVADAKRLKRITGFTILGRDIPIDDEVQFWVDHLAGRGASKFGGEYGSAPIIVNNDSFGGQGRRGTVHLLYSDTNQTDLFAPLIEKIRMRWEYVDGDLQDLSAQTPAAD